MENITLGEYHIPSLKSVGVETDILPTGRLCKSYGKGQGRVTLLQGDLQVIEKNSDNYSMLPVLFI